MVAKPPKNLTPGEILRWRRVGGLLLAEVELEPGQHVHRDAHAHAQFILVLSGSLTEVVGEDRTTFARSTLLFRRGGEPHTYQVPNGTRCLIVDMDPAWLERAREHAPLLARSAAFRRGLLLHLAQRLYDEFRQRDEVARLAIESLALGVLAEASRRGAPAAERRVPLWLQMAMTIVEQRFAERLLLTEVAKIVGVHPVHLARTFRRVYRTTFAGYVQQARVDFARRQLAGQAALSEIACAAGFCDQSHFSRCFKRHTGLTPAEYRASLG